MAVTYRADEPLKGDINVAVISARIPSSYVLKGMFFHNVKQRIPPSEYNRIESSLEQAPRDGRYVPFKDYPQKDYIVLVAAAAASEHPGVGLRESIRLMARSDSAALATFTIGRVVLSGLRDAHHGLMSLPAVYDQLMAGSWQVVAVEIDERCVQLEWQEYYGSWEYVLGTLESICMYFGATTEIVKDRRPGHVLRFRVQILSEPVGRLTGPASIPPRSRP